MLKTVFYLALLFCLSMSALSAITVVLPAPPTLQEQTAAKELVFHLTKVYGTKIRTVSEKSIGKDTQFIYLGKTRFAAKAGIDTAKLALEEHLVKAVDGKNLVITGGGPRGVFYGVFDLLEKYCGVLWLDDEYTVIPKAKICDWPKGFQLKGKPDFQIRCIHTYWSNNHRARQLNAFRNRQNLLHDQRYTDFLKSYGLDRIYGSPRVCHTYYDYTKDWGKENEDCFSLGTNGKRIRSTSAGGPGQICWTNPKTVQLFSKKLRQFILEDRKKFGKPYPWLYEVSDNDNGYRCNCKNCLAMAKKYKGYSGIVIDFTNKLARTIAKEFPDVIIQMMAYKDVKDVPQGIKADKNVWVRFGISRDTVRPFSHPNNKKIADLFREYKKIGTVTIWDWWIMYYNTTMGINYHAIPETLQLFKEIGAVSLMIEHEKPLETPFYELRIWLGRRYMVDTRRDLAKETKCFMEGYYGKKAAPVMQELLDYMIKRESRVKQNLNDLAPQQRTDLDETFFRKTSALIDKALSLADDPMHKKHIRKERFVLDYANLMRNRTNVHFDPAVFEKRMRSDFALLVPLYLNNRLGKEFHRNMDAALVGLTAKIPPVKGLNDYEIVFDLTWPRLNEFRKSKLINVPDAAGGKALFLADIPQYGGSVRMGFYNISTPGKSLGLVIPAAKTPQDEKFHLYRIGKITLEPQGYFWAHPTWNIQIPSNQFYNPHDPSGKRVNDYELFMSVKAEGPNYVKGSSKVSALYLDRIILARKKKK